MARSKSFDPAEKLEVAMHLFWRKGFEATSLDHLELELGLKRFSIYNAFGDKLNLYRQSLELYLSRYFYPALDRLRSNRCLLGISEFFSTQVGFLKEAPQGYGCFVYKAALEMESEHEEIALLTQKARRELLHAFYLALRADESKGSLSGIVEPEASSRWLLTVYRGLISSDCVEQEKVWMDGFNQQLQELFTCWEAEAC